MMNKNNCEPANDELGCHAGFSFNRNAIVIGVTGGIATGKSTICNMFRELGAEVISADEVVHRLMAEDEDVIKKIIHEFGEGICDNNGVIDRKKLGSIVFSDSEKLRKLEEIVHPRVLSYLEQKANDFRQHSKGVLLLEIPLLIETSSMGMVDKIIVVSADQESQVERLRKRYPQMTTCEIMKRINSQLSLDTKKKYADWVIDTEKSITSNREDVARIWDALQNLLAHTK